MRAFGSQGKRHSIRCGAVTQDGGPRGGVHLTVAYYPAPNTGAAPDCLQPTLVPRCGFRQQVKPGTQHYTHLGDSAPCASSCYNPLSLTMERSVAMSDWVAAELAACQMHDVRHTKRLARLLERLSERP